MEASTISLSDDLLRKLCAYAPEQLLNRLMQTKKSIASLTTDASFWNSLLVSRGWYLFESLTKISASQLAQLFFNVNDQFGYLLMQGNTVVFDQYTNNFFLSTRYVWVLTVDGQVYSASIDDTTRWTHHVLDEKIRAIRGRVDESLVVVGDDSVFIIDRENSTITPICDSDARDYYVDETQSTIMAVHDEPRVLGIALQSREDSAIGVTVFLEPFSTLLSRMKDEGNRPARKAGGFSFDSSSIPSSKKTDINDSQDAYSVHEPTQTREENNIVYYEGGYDAENVKDIVSEFNNSEYYGEDDAF